MKMEANCLSTSGVLEKGWFVLALVSPSESFQIKMSQVTIQPTAIYHMITPIFDNLTFSFLNALLYYENWCNFIFSTLYQLNSYLSPFKVTYRKNCILYNPVPFQFMYLPLTLTEKVSHLKNKRFAPNTADPITDRRSVLKQGGEIIHNYLFPHF